MPIDLDASIQTYENMQHTVKDGLILQLATELRAAHNRLALTELAQKAMGLYFELMKAKRETRYLKNYINTPETEAAFARAHKVRDEYRAAISAWCEAMKERDANLP